MKTRTKVIAGVGVALVVTSIALAPEDEAVIATETTTTIEEATTTTIETTTTTEAPTTTTEAPTTTTTMMDPWLAEQAWLTLMREASDEMSTVTWVDLESDEGMIMVYQALVRAIKRGASDDELAELALESFDGVYGLDTMNEDDAALMYMAIRYAQIAHESMGGNG